MHVLLNDRALHRTRTGVGHYIEQVLRCVPLQADDVQVRGFWSGTRTPGERSADPPRKTPRAAPPPAPTPASTGSAQRRDDLNDGRRPWWLRNLLQTGYGWALAAAAQRYALYHEPNHIPVATGRPTVTTIHDLSALEHPQWHPADRVRWYERHFAAGLRRTRVFLTVSAFTRQRMIDLLGVAPQRVVVSPLAAREVFSPRDAAQQADVRRRLQAPERFFLFVGTLEPRKNLPGLLDAYARLPVAIRRGASLVIAGAWGWQRAALQARLSDLATRDAAAAAGVQLCGYVSDDDLARLYSACIALVWPTFYEGFGLPPIEALACGAPVITSSCTSLPEVVGDAGVLLDPLDVDAWSGAMRRLVEDPGWRAELARRGPPQAARFTWARFATQTAAAYRLALG